jgi:hypothetical protein
MGLGCYFYPMKKWGFLVLTIITFAACQPSDNTPDVSDIKVDVQIQRFDQDFFATNVQQLDQGLDQLNRKYPGFFPEFLLNVLGIHPSDTAAGMAIGAFIQSYRSVFDSANLIANKALPAFEKDFTKGLQLWKHYFPNHPIDSPFVVTTFVGPMDALEPFPLGDYGDVRTNTGIGIALQFHLGANASIYDAGQRAGVLYEYQTKRFTPEMMLVNGMKNMISDAFPYNSNANNLVEEMIEKGKRLYVLDKLLPNTADTLKLGYTSQQLDGSFQNEALIWNYFVKNDLLYNKELSVMQLYIRDGPKTAELGDASPGYIGLFVGRQLVRSYMKTHPELSLEQLIKTSNQEILNNGGYKP